MTGKDIIIHILENDLIDCEVVTDIRDAALKCNVGLATIEYLVAKGRIQRNELYWIPKVYVQEVNKL